MRGAMNRLWGPAARGKGVQNGDFAEVWPEF
jgi:hypothetical protein